jgi:hypothetical protein
MNRPRKASKRKELSAGKPRERLIPIPRLLATLANLPDDGASRLRERWKSHLPDAAILQARDELRLLWSHFVPAELGEDGDSLKHPVPILSDYAERLSDGWHGELMEKPLPQLVCEMWLKEAGAGALPALLVDWRNRRLRPNPRSLPIALVWGCLHNADRLAYCRNPACAAPYFVAKRKDQKYCSARCAAPAARAAKRRWWKANRAASGRKRTVL